MAQNSTEAAAIVAAKAGPRKGEGSISDAINYFIRNNRKKIIIAAIVVVVIALGFIAWVLIRDALENRAIAQVEDLTVRYEALRFDINEADSAEDVAALLTDMLDLGKGSFGYAAARAYALAAAVCADQKNWAGAENYWMLSAAKGKNMYLGPVSIYNAAVAAEEAGNIEAALEHYRDAASRAEFPGAVRAQFAMGRLLEQSDTAAAIEVYRQIASEWSTETVWVNLAQSRIIILSLKAE
ncbi:MAG: tetratricopeptide repeat protein [Treponema sp.]|jgi:tetratricopeptide (TPR) repeat protein|nr:tetratricopeptide repeat protein [Treponema sp.]